MEGMIYDLRSVAHLRSCDVCDTRLSVICDLLRAGWLSGADPGTIDDRKKKKNGDRHWQTFNPLQRAFSSWPYEPNLAFR